MSVSELASFSGLNRIKDFVAACRDAGEPASLVDLRQRAADACTVLSWPTVREEEWRRTRVTEFDFDSLSYPLPANTGKNTSSVYVGKLDDKHVPTWVRQDDVFEDDEAADKLSAAKASELAAFVRVGLDGAASSGDSALRRNFEILTNPVVESTGLKIIELSAVLAAGADTVIQKKLLRLFDYAISKADNKFANWNLAAWSAGLVVYAPRFVEEKKPVVIDWELSGDDIVHQPILFVIAEEGARIEVMQRWHGAGGYLLNSGTYTDLGASSQVRLAGIQDCSTDAVVVSHAHAIVERDGAYKASETCLGSGFAKGRSVADLEGPGADAHIFGMYFGEDEQHIDLRTVQNHHSARATSRAFYKGVVRDSARTIYQGLIYVAPHAPKTDAYLTNRNLVLNDGARADSIPSLQIQTDDVKCSHGSTTGRINPEHLFYLANRGLDKDAATQLIIQAYLAEAGIELPALAKAHVGATLRRRIRRG